MDGDWSRFTVEQGVQAFKRIESLVKMELEIHSPGETIIRDGVPTNEHLLRPHVTDTTPTSITHLHHLLGIIVIHPTPTIPNPCS